MHIYSNARPLNRLPLKVRYLHSDVDTAGRVEVLYADRIMDSMKRAIDETERRRARQIAFNEANGITPKDVQKKIKEMIDGVYSAAARKAMLNDDGLSEAAAKVEAAF